ncbi:hypothetical protein ABW21_db0203482 [Orbilia brochopaga]|nr:hypothetical protein ABW21_db0203482 [Drechslerella brochopaga]
MARYHSLTASMLIPIFPYLATALPTPTSLPSTTTSPTADATSSATSTGTPQKGPSMLATISYFGIAVCGSIIIVLLATAWINYRRKRRPAPPPVSQVRKDFFEYVQAGGNQGQQTSPIVMAQASPTLHPEPPQDMISSKLYPQMRPEPSPTKLAEKFKSRYSNEEADRPTTSSSSKPMLKIEVTSNPGIGNANRRTSFIPEYFIPKRQKRETFIPHPLTAPGLAKPKAIHSHNHMRIPPMPQFGIGAKIAYNPSNSPVTPIDNSPVSARTRASQRTSKYHGNRRSEAYARSRKSRGHSIVSPKRQAYDGRGQLPRQSRISRRIRPISSTTIASSIVSEDDDGYYDYDDSYDDDVDGDDDEDYYDDRYSYDSGRDHRHYQHQHQHQQHHLHQLSRYQTRSRENLGQRHLSPISSSPPRRDRDERRPTTANSTSTGRSVALAPGLGIHAVQIPPHSPRSSREPHDHGAAASNRGYAHSSSGRSMTSATSKTSRATVTTKTSVGGSGLRQVYNESDRGMPTPPPVPPKDWEVVPVQIGGFPTFVATIKPSSRATPGKGLPVSPRPDTDQWEQQDYGDEWVDERPRHRRI